MNKKTPGWDTLKHRGGCRRLTSQRGQALYLVISLIVVLMAFASIGVDISMLWGTQLRMQNAADAAALAGADSLYAGGSGNVTTAGRAAAAQNGYTNALGTAGNPNHVTVTINNPPSSGNYTSNNQAVEAIVQQSQPSLFSSVAGFVSFPIAGRAVSVPGSSSSCIYLLAPSGSNALKVASSGSITSSCGIMVDSNDPSAISVDAGASITAPTIGVVGGASYNGGTITPAPITAIASFADPLSALQPPTLGTCVNVPNSSQINLSPGYYCSLTVNNGVTATLSAGNYSFNGNVNINSSSSISGSGVSLYFKKGALSIQSNANANLSAPTSGAYNGILIYQDRADNSAPIINGGGTVTLNGALYLPDAYLNINSPAIANVYSIVVALQISVQSKAVLNLNSDYSSLAGGSPTKHPVIVE